MTSPQDPWQQYQQQQYSSGEQQAPYGTPSGGFAQQNVPGYQQQSGYPQQPGYPQQQAYPQQGYQAYPQGGGPPNSYAAPQVSAQAGMGPAKPATVNAAFWIAIAVPALSLLMMVISFFLTYSWQQNLMADMMEQSGLSTGSQEMQATLQITNGVMIGTYVFMVIMFLILTGLWVLFGFKMRAGRNWARITLTVFASIWILFGIAGVINGGLGAMGASGASQQLPPGVNVDMTPPTGVMALSYTQSALALIAMIAFIVLVFLKQSNWYFKAASHS